MLLTQVSCRSTVQKDKHFDIRIDLVNQSQKEIIKESGVKVIEESSAYTIAKATKEQFNFLVKKKISVVTLPEMDRVYKSYPTRLKDTNYAIHMEVYRTVWDFMSYKPNLTKKYQILEVKSGESFSDIEGWLNSFYTFMYEFDKKVTEEIRKDENIKEEVNTFSSDSIKNLYMNINSRVDLEKLIQNMITPNETKNINLTEKYFTGKESNEIFLVVQLTRTKTDLEVTITNYKLVLSALEESKILMR
jgi:hypothetical protein